MLLTMDMSLNGASPLKSNQGFNCPETKNNKMKKIIFLFCLLIIGVLLANAQTEKFTLRHTIDTALKTIYCQANRTADAQCREKLPAGNK